MNSQAIRWACKRARPDLERVGVPLKDYFHIRPFSSTPSPRAESSGNGSTRPTTARERALAAASQINSLVKKREHQRHQQTSEGSDKPQVIDVRSLPRGLGRGGLRGGPQFRGRGGGGAISRASGNRFSPGNRGRITRGRGGRGGGGRGGRGGTQRGKREEGGGAAGARGRQDPFERMDAAEKAFDDAMRFGSKTQYSPELSMESLADYLPAVPTRAGRRATVMANLSVLGTADAIGAAQNLQARSYGEEVDGWGMRFFADAASREAAQEYLSTREGEEGDKVIVQGAEEGIREVIMDRAVRGRHEAPEFAGDARGIARSWHLRAETYTQGDVERFDKRLQSILKGGSHRARA